MHTSKNKPRIQYRSIGRRKVVSARVRLAREASAEVVLYYPGGTEGTEEWDLAMGQEGSFRVTNGVIIRLERTAGRPHGPML